jgi:hypothetical protein
MNKRTNFINVLIILELSMWLFIFYLLQDLFQLIQKYVGLVNSFQDSITKNYIFQQVYLFK